METTTANRSQSNGKAFQRLTKAEQAQVRADFADFAYSQICREQTPAGTVRQGRRPMFQPFKKGAK